MMRTIGSRLKKSLKSIQITQLVLELVVVFLGVYLAFLLSNHQAEKKFSQDSRRVLSTLIESLRNYEGVFGGYAKYHQGHNDQFRDKLDSNVIPDFSGSTYPSPQYPVRVIDHIVTRESFDVFTFEVYKPLAAYANRIRQLIYVEEKLVEMGEKYELLPPQTDPGYPRAAMLQLLNARRYLMYLDIRESICADLQQRSAELAEKLAEIAAR